MTPRGARCTRPCHSMTASSHSPPLLLSAERAACDGVEHHRNGNQVVGVSTSHTVRIRTMTQMETGATYRVPHMEKAGIIAQRIVRQIVLHHRRRPLQLLYRHRIL